MAEVLTGLSHRSFLGVNGANSKQINSCEEKKKKNNNKPNKLKELKKTPSRIRAEATGKRVEQLGSSPSRGESERERGAEEERWVQGRAGAS